MRRILVVLTIAAALGAGFVFVGRAVAPCSPALAPLSRLGLTAPAHCAGVEAAAAEAPPAVEPPTVTVTPAGAREFGDQLFVSGPLVAREEVMVAAQVDGLAVVELDAEDGDTVKAGQVLARLDRSQLDAMVAENDATTARADAAIAQAHSQIEQAQVQVGWANDDFDRANKLGPQVIAASTIEQRQTTLRTSRALLSAAEHALAVAEADRKSRDAERSELMVRIARAEVKAPVAGVVSRRTARLGASSSGAGEALFRIISDGAIDLDADVPEQSLVRLRTGMTARLNLPGVAEPVEGTVRLISREVDKASRTGKVRIALPPDAPARIGSFATAEISIARNQGVGVPASAVQRDSGGARLLVVRDGVVEQRRVAPGIAEGDTLQILSGVAPGETVVARAAAFLRPGDRVRAILASTQGATP